MLTALGSKQVLNRYPRWKYVLLIAMLVIGILYSLPNFYGEQPAVQVAANNPGITIDQTLLNQVSQLLQQQHIPIKGTSLSEHFLQVRFKNLDSQLKASEILKQHLGKEYTVAITLAPATPNWLRFMGAAPMKYGLDLRGGVHFLLDVDLESVIKRRITGEQKNMAQDLRKADLRYSGLQLLAGNRIQINFRDAAVRNKANSRLSSRYPDYQFIQQMQHGEPVLIATMTKYALTAAQKYVIDQTMTTLRNRVDELGISDPVVQQQGLDRISVDLPGVQDASQAKKILGGTATVEFHLVDEAHDAANYINKQAPIGSKLYMKDGRAYLLKKQVILQGASITNASASFGEDGRPNVNIRLGGGGEAFWARTTRENIGHLLATLYIEPTVEIKKVGGKEVRIHHRLERLINVATIDSALGNSFQIMGLDNAREASNLALLLRAGTLPATITIAQERTVGPSLGKENISKGLLSVVIGFLLVVVCMAAYYRGFGMIANVALLVNLVLIVAILSMLGMVLTLPGIAGIVLNVGMAVDANVLIFERIREELRNGVSPQASIFAGYERAFATIVDANVTTLIAAIALFGIGSGPIKGFAVTLTIGILTSMVTAITGTRALVNAFYGNRQVKKLSIGI